METSNVDTQQRPRRSLDDELVTVLGGDRSAVALDDTTLEGLYRDMLRARLTDECLAGLASSGRTHVHIPTRGQEAAVIGAAAALGTDDWIFPTVRDLGAFLHRDVSLDRIFANAFGNAADAAKGRQMPAHLTARAERIASVGSLPGTHLGHAAGLAWAAKISRDPIVVAAFADREAVPSADFHTGLNFAAVFDAPAVFVFRNEHRGERTTPVAPKGVAYGMAGVRADGDDVLAVHAVVAEAVDKARRGGGPTLVEVVTGRADPLEAFGAWLSWVGVMEPAAQDALRAEIAAELDGAVDRASRLGAPARSTLFDDVYAALPAHLAEQRDS